MDGVGDRGSTLFEGVGQIADFVLGLGQGHAVTRNDDHVLRLRQKRPESRALNTICVFYFKFLFF